MFEDCLGSVGLRNGCLSLLCSEGHVVCSRFLTFKSTRSCVIILCAGLEAGKTESGQGL